MRCTPVITHNKRISTPPTLAGLFFCFASAEDAGLLFLLYCNTATYKRLQRVLFRPCKLYRPRHVGAYHSAVSPPSRTGYQTPHRTLCRSAQPPYYNKVYKGAAVRPMLWIHAGRCSIPQTIPARRGQLLPSADRWQVLHPAHLLRGQRLRLYRVSLSPSTRRGSPAAGA